MTDERDSIDESDDRDDTAEQSRCDRALFTEDPVTHAEVWAGMSAGELIDEYGNAGVGAKTLHDAVDVSTQLFEEDVTTVFSLAGAMVPAGMRTIVAELLRDGYVDALVTTGANLTHDTIDAIGGHHHHGESHHDELTEREHDEALRSEGVDRIYNVYLPQEHFTAFERHLRSEVFPDLADECDDAGSISIERLTRELGRANAAANERDEVDADPGIAAAAAQQGVPIYCPAIVDSVLGLQTWMYAQTSALTLDAVSDVTSLTDLVYDATERGAFIVGGGVPKNFTLQSMLVTPSAYDYAVQLTMDPPQTGGLSGATLDEARSWGKLEPDAANVSVYGDATITLPLVIAATRERLENR